VPVKSEQRKIQSGLDIKTFLSRLRLVNEVVFAITRRHRQTRHVDGKYEGRFRNTLRRVAAGSGNAGPSGTCISWRKRGSASDQLRRKKKQSVNRAALLQVRAARGNVERNLSLMFRYANRKK